jgi:hypothetical protein
MRRMIVEREGIKLPKRWEAESPPVANHGGPDSVEESWTESASPRRRQAGRSCKRGHQLDRPQQAIANGCDGMGATLRNARAQTPARKCAAAARDVRRAEVMRHEMRGLLGTGWRMQRIYRACLIFLFYGILGKTRRITPKRFTFFMDTFVDTGLQPIPKNATPLRVSKNPG